MSEPHDVVEHAAVIHLVAAHPGTTAVTTRTPAAPQRGDGTPGDGDLLPPTLSAAQPVDDALPAARKREAKRKQKLRSAWIGFASRIIAQVVGALATVTLGIAAVHHYTGPRSEAIAQSAVATVPASALRVRASAGPPALAVLPLDNYSGDAAQDAFADGLTEALIGHLARSRSVRVISRTSAMSYKGQRKPLTAIASELGVDLVVEGSVVRAGRRLRVTAQLIDARTDEHLWAQSYDRAIDDVLALQERIATAITRELNAAVLPLARSPASPAS